jgi:hypothetical protein
MMEFSCRLIGWLKKRTEKKSLPGGKLSKAASLTSADKVGTLKLISVNVFNVSV